MTTHGLIEQGAASRHEDAAEAAALMGSPQGDLGVWPLVLAIYLLSLASFSLPGRRGPLTLAALDWVAVVKVISRGAALVLLGATYWRRLRSPRKRRVLRRLIPFGVFAGWAILSAFWSPLPAASFGHGGELALLVLLAAVAGDVCADDRNLSRVLFHLTVAVLIMGVVNSGPWAGTMGPGERPRAFMHPNVAAQVGAVGLIVVTASYLIGGWRWAKLLLLPSFAINGWLLFIAQSRTANGATFVALCACAFVFARRRSLPFVALLVGVALTGYLTLDPQTELLGHAQDRLVAYVMRGQTKAEFMSATGRTEIWAVGFRSFRQAPVIGHGYAMMTPTGRVPALGRYQWETAHNAFLHVLTGTGLVGTLLLLAALYVPISVALTGLLNRYAQRRTAAFVLIVFAWFLMVGMYELSFLGPVSAVPVAFFLTVGLAVGRL